LKGVGALPFPARSTGKACRRHTHEVLGSLTAGKPSAQTEIDASFGAVK